MSEIVGVTVTLSPMEMEIAAVVGAHRRIENIHVGRKDSYGAMREENGWTLDIEGAAGEMAVAKWSGKYWCGNLGDLKADDVGRLQVRSTANHTGRLIIHEKDRDDRAFILVTGTAPTLVLRGWMWGKEAKQQCYWADPTAGGRPAFFVPQCDLRPIKARAG